MTYPNILELKISPTGDRLAVSGDPYGNFGAVAALPKNTVGVAYRFGLGT